MRCNFLLFLLLASLLASVFFFWKRSKRDLPALPVTFGAFFCKKNRWKVRLAVLPETCYWLACLLLLFTLCDPRAELSLGGMFSQKKVLPREGIALYFLLDQSGSMDEEVSVTTGTDALAKVKKIDMAKKVISQFILGNNALGMPGRENDLIGLVAFARAANVLSPLTLDRTKILESLRAIEPIQEDRLNGTAIGYAIFKTVNMIVATKYFAERNSQAAKPVYSIDNQAIIIVTDGLQSPNPADRNSLFRFIPPEEALNYAKANGVRVYFIGVDPIFARAEAAEEVDRLKSAVKATGGSFFMATVSLPIEEIFAKIDTLEKIKLAPDLAGPVREVSLVPYVLLLAMFILLAGILGETALVRKVP